MHLQAIIIRAALRFQTRPFTWIFRAYYGLAIRSSRWLVGRAPGVRSIYLSGSLAGEDVIYGLSDIDFKIFVSGERSPAVYRSIRRRFRLLRRLFPMLGSPDEKGIYFLDSFASEYAHYPLVRHLFDGRFFRHRRIFGEDVIRALPVKPWQELDQGECAHGRLKDWIERIHILADGDALGGQQKQHLFFKAVCDVALLAIRIRRPDFAFRRRADILRRILPELNEADRALAENLIAENGSRYRWKRNGDGDNYRLFKSMVALCGERAACGGEVEASFPQIESCVADHPDADPVVARTLAGFSGKIRQVRGIFWPQLPQGPFDLEFFGVPVYLLVCAEFLDLHEFRRLKAYYRKNLKGKSGVFLFEDSKFLSSVDSDLVDCWGGFPESSDLLHLLLGEGHPKRPSVRMRQRIGARAQGFAEQLAGILENPGFGRMELAVFPRFLFQALRVLIFHYEFGRQRWEWPVTPGQVALYMTRNTPVPPEFVDALVRQHEKVLREGARFDERLMPKCRALLRAMLDVCLHGGCWDSLESLNALPDAGRLSISVAVVTADRPRQLRRCLESIAGLSRPPEELVVVDGGRDASARPVVGEFGCGFAVRYFRGESRGVAALRNVAVRAAAGDIIAFLDDDATVDPGWLDRLERAFLRDPEIGLAGGAILNMDCGRSDSVWRFMQAVEKI